MRLTQVRDETPGNLGEGATKLSDLVFPEEVKENAAIQAQLADFFVDVLENERIRHEVIREATNQVVNWYKPDPKQ